MMKEQKETLETVKITRDTDEYAVIEYNKIVTKPPSGWINRNKKLIALIFPRICLIYAPKNLKLKYFRKL